MTDKPDNPPALLEQMFWHALHYGDLIAANEYRHAMLRARQEKPDGK